MHVDYVPSTATESFQSLEAAKRASTQSLGSASNPDVSSPTPESARRHQIPGLRRTPYLKVYLLRCDDGETYKASSRKLLREWQRMQAHPQHSSGGSAPSSQADDHNAFEWLIVHVVLPGTSAAAQPRWTGTSGSTEKSGGTKLLSRSSGTLFEKIRSDFNAPSKNAPDRVAQVRLKTDRIAPENRHLLPKTVGGPASNNDHVESPQEQNYAWNDLVAKSKNLILMSFDLRVAQYEDDIRQKDSQRSLPGWNFCTFFILKEGLARGFESVGLVEDALVAYDELTIGLDTVIQELESDETGGQATSFLPYTNDVFQQFKACSGNPPEEARVETVGGSFRARPIDTSRKNYRDLILANKVSVFEFKCYIFARQILLLLRLANAQTGSLELLSKHKAASSFEQGSRDDKGVGTKIVSSTADKEDLTFLAELCQRGLAYISNAARDLQRDLNAGISATKFTSLTGSPVENFVSSWVCSAASQVLELTRTSSLPVSYTRDDTRASDADKSLPLVDRQTEMKFAVPEPKTMIHPARTSSLLSPLSPRGAPGAEYPYAVTPPSGRIVFTQSTEFPSELRSPNQDISSPQLAKAGLEDLAAGRAELHLLQRRALERVGSLCGWRVGWQAFVSDRLQERAADMEAVSLDDDETKSQGEASPVAVHNRDRFTKGLYHPLLVSSMTSLDCHRQAFEKLTDLAIQHFIAGHKTQSSETLSADMAALKFEVGDYESAAMIFSRMAPMFRRSGWNYIETALLKMYARCLKKLERDDQYVDIVLGILSKAVSAIRASAIPKHSTRRSRGIDSLSRKWDQRHWLNEDEMDTTGMLADLCDSSSKLSQDVTVQMLTYFGNVVVEPFIQHFDEQDGFRLRLVFKHHLEDDILLQKATVRIICISSNSSQEVLLESEKNITINKGMARLWVQTNLCTSGVFVVDKILLEAQRLHFVHEPFAKGESAPALGISSATVSAAPTKVAKKSRIACFPRPESLHADIRVSELIHIDRPRNLILRICTGWNDVEKAEVRLKSGSAGLRLRTANAEVLSGEASLEESNTLGVVTVGRVGVDSSFELLIPYELENSLPEIAIRTEITYFVEKGTFQFISFTTVPVDLPLDVNVYDHFKADVLFSRFNIKAANNVPLKLFEAQLKGSEDFTVQAPQTSALPLLVFPKQPAVLPYKILPNFSESSGRKDLKESPLQLTVKYKCLDEEVVGIYKRTFAEALKSTQFNMFYHLLVPALVSRLQHHVLQGQYETIALLESADLGPFEDMAWEEHTEMLPAPIGEDLRVWLRNWHNVSKILHNT